MTGITVEPGAVVDAIVEYFAGEAMGPERAALLIGNQPTPALRRGLLATLLTVRDPAPIPEQVLAQLEQLLTTERDARGVVDAFTLPTLAEQGSSAGLFPFDRVAFWRGDLTRLQADGIVNAANDRMLGCFTPNHACIDNAIHAAAGPTLRQECAEHMATQGHPEPTGTATVTGAGMLPSRAVIHTVGPIVRGELTETHRTQLADAYRAILDAAHDHSMSTVGLCSVSTGVFGFPKDAAAAICLSTVRDWFAAHPEEDLRVVVSLFADVDEGAYLAALKTVGAE